MAAANTRNGLELSIHCSFYRKLIRCHISIDVLTDRNLLTRQIVLATHQNVGHKALEGVLFACKYTKEKHPVG